MLHKKYYKEKPGYINNVLIKSGSIAIILALLSLAFRFFGFSFFGYLLATVAFFFNFLAFYVAIRYLFNSLKD